MKCKTTTHRAETGGRSENDAGDGEEKPGSGVLMFEDPNHVRGDAKMLLRAVKNSWLSEDELAARRQQVVDALGKADKPRHVVALNRVLEAMEERNQQAEAIEFS